MLIHFPSAQHITTYYLYHVFRLFIFESSPTFPYFTLSPPHTHLDASLHAVTDSPRSSPVLSSPVPCSQTITYRHSTMTAGPGTFGSMTPGHQHPINLRLEQESASTPDKGIIVMMVSASRLNIH